MTVLFGNFWSVDLKALHHDCQIQTVHCFDLVSNVFRQDKNILTKHSINSLLLKRTDEQREKN